MLKQQFKRIPPDFWDVNQPSQLLVSPGPIQNNKLQLM